MSLLSRRVRGSPLLLDAQVDEGGVYLKDGGDGLDVARGGCEVEGDEVVGVAYAQAGLGAGKLEHGRQRRFAGLDGRVVCRRVDVPVGYICDGAALEQERD